MRPKPRVISRCSRRACDSTTGFESLRVDRRLGCQDRFCAFIAEWNSTNEAFPDNGNRHRYPSRQRTSDSGERRRRYRECHLSPVGTSWARVADFTAAAFLAIGKALLQKDVIAGNRVGGSSSRAFVTPDGLVKDPAEGRHYLQHDRQRCQPLRDCLGQWGEWQFLASVLN
jgi:hypothetical protein